MRPYGKLLLGTVLVLASTACAHGQSSRSQASPAPSTGPVSTIAPTTTLPRLSGGYLSSAPTGAVFLQITMTGQGSVEGSAAFHVATRNGPVDEQNHFLGAVSSNGDLTLGFDNIPAGTWHLGRSWSGSMDSDGRGFTMYLHQPDGKLAAARFLPATVADFDAAVERSHPKNLGD